MKYELARDSIKDGDVLAWTHRATPLKSWYDFKVWAVRLFQASEYTHVGIALRFGGRVFVLESVTGGIRIMPLSKLLPCYLLSDVQPFSEVDVERAMSVCGEPYSNFEAIRGLFDDTDAGDGKWQCAEFVKWAKRLPCKATPSAVVNHLLANEGVMVEIQP